MTVEVTVDGRRRLSLGALATRDKYLADVDEDGVIVLVPAVTMSEMEARLMARPDILAQIEESRRSGEVAAERPQRRKPA